MATLFIATAMIGGHIVCHGASADRQKAVESLRDQLADTFLVDANGDEWEVEERIDTIEELLTEEKAEDQWGMRYQIEKSEAL